MRNALNLVAAVEIAAGRFVRRTGERSMEAASDGTFATGHVIAGVCEATAEAGIPTTITTQGPAKMRAGAEIIPGVHHRLTTDVNGRAKPAGAGDQVCALFTGLETAQLGHEIDVEVQLGAQIPAAVVTPNAAAISIADAGDLFTGENVELALQEAGADIVQNTTDVAQNTTDVAQNTTDIAQNTTDVAQNTTDIAQNQTDIATKSALVTGQVDVTMGLLETSRFSAGAGNSRKPAFWNWNGDPGDPDNTLTGAVLEDGATGDYYVKLSVIPAGSLTDGIHISVLTD